LQRRVPLHVIKLGKGTRCPAENRVLDDAFNALAGEPYFPLIGEPCQVFSAGARGQVGVAGDMIRVRRCARTFIPPGWWTLRLAGQ
jgi:hypothetical protein